MVPESGEIGSYQVEAFPLKNIISLAYSEELTRRGVILLVLTFRESTAL